MSHPTPLAPAKAGAHLGSAITAAEGVKRDKSARARTPVREMSMHALRRILGDEVLDIFPEGIIETTDELFKLHSQDKEAYAFVTFETARDRDDALALMRAYAECADDPGYTIRTDRDTEPNELRFRVTLRKGSGSGETTPEGESTT